MKNKKNAAKMNTTSILYSIAVPQRASLWDFTQYKIDEKKHIDIYIYIYLYIEKKLYISIKYLKSFNIY